MALNFSDFNSEHLDFDAALTRFLNDDEILWDAIEIFLVDAPERLQKMRQLLSEKNLDSLAKETHKLKSESGTVGAVIAQRLCSELEDCALKNNSESSEKLLGQISEEITLVIGTFSRIKETDF
ncbi:Hpt domain-containing protein [Maridesulfovibrio bastinii]|uniref:Hpt domain-containing protein n=1 Tax=Maridesulfovibrio bastinii TaxID=47157 RepID=UPI000415E129|nr:Hpt domain-containing protein [Maridesulfovibrio bastinii]